MSIERKELTAFERGEVIGAWKCGLSEQKISEILNHPQSTINKIIGEGKESMG
jgi:IS30 family transposase